MYIHFQIVHISFFVTEKIAMGHNKYSVTKLQSPIPYMTRDQPELKTDNLVKIL